MLGWNLFRNYLAGALGKFPKLLGVLSLVFKVTEGVSKWEVLCNVLYTFISRSNRQKFGFFTLKISEGERVKVAGTFLYKFNYCMILLLKKSRFIFLCFLVISIQRLNFDAKTNITGWLLYSLIFLMKDSKNDQILNFLINTISFYLILC